MGGSTKSGLDLWFLFLYTTVYYYVPMSKSTIVLPLSNVITKTIVIMSKSKLAKSH